MVKLASSNLIFEAFLTIKSIFLQAVESGKGKLAIPQMGPPWILRCLKSQFLMVCSIYKHAQINLLY